MRLLKVAACSSLNSFMLSDEEKARLQAEKERAGYNRGIPGTIEHFRASSIPGSIEFEQDPQNAIAGSIGATKDSEITDSERESAAFHGVEEPYVEGFDHHINESREDTFEEDFFPNKFGD